MILRILFLFMFLFMSSVFAVKEEKIRDVMVAKTEQVVKLLQNPNISRDDKTKRLFVIMDDVFDFPKMAEISLGKTYKEIDEKTRDSFTTLFVKRVKESYLDKIDLYTNEKIEVKELTKVKDNRIQLLANIVGKDKIYDIVYKFYDVKDGNWLIYDVDILGVSIVQTYRKQFGEFLQTKNMDELIENLRVANNPTK